MAIVCVLIEKAYMLCIRFEPGPAEWKSHTDPHFIICVKKITSERICQKKDWV